MVVRVGPTTGDEPFAIKLPPHEPVYHFQSAPVPKVPPETDNVDDATLQIVEGLAEAEFAITEFVLRVTVTVAHVVVLQSPTAAT